MTQHAFTPKHQLSDVEDVSLRPKTRLQTQLDGLGRTARGAVNAVTGGKMGCVCLCVIVIVIHAVARNC